LLKLWPGWHSDSAVDQKIVDIFGFCWYELCRPGPARESEKEIKNAHNEDGRETYEHAGNKNEG